MKFEDLKPGMQIRIAANHISGYGGRTGKVIAIGTFEGGPKRIGALVDINEPCLLVIEPDDLDPVEPDPLPPGWAEFEV
ncbi:hypothetical protein D3C76_1773010 [compost metagenome]